MPAANMATTRTVEVAGGGADVGASGAWGFTDVAVGDLDDVPERVAVPGTLVVNRQVCNPGDLS